MVGRGGSLRSKKNNGVGRGSKASSNIHIQTHPIIEDANDMEHDPFIDATGSNTDSPYRDDPIDEQSPRSCTHINQDLDNQVEGNKKHSTKIAARLGKLLNEHEAADPICEEESNMHPTQHASRHRLPSSAVSDTTLKKKRGERGKYRSMALLKKTLGGRTKLEVEILDQVLQAIGENARDLVNYCGYVVRTTAPMNAKNWASVASSHGDQMWKQVQDAFKLKEANRGDARLHAFVIETMQRLYRYWKHELHAYYTACGETDQDRLANPPEGVPEDQWKHCVETFGSDAYKKISERNKKNRGSEKWCKHTTGSKSFPEVEHIMTQQNNGVKPNAAVIWLAEHTHYNKNGVLEWVNDKRSKGVHKELEIFVQNKDKEGAPQTQEEMLVEVLGERSGYVRGKGNGYKSSIKGKLHMEQQQKIDEQREKIDAQ